MVNNWQKSWKGRIAKFIFETYNNRENDNVSDHFFNLTIDQLLWRATTIIKDDEKLVNIKYVGQRYWSKNAIKHYCQLNPLEEKGLKACVNLRHEHAVPRKIIKEKIINILNKQNNSNKNSKIKEVYKIINKYSKSVVVTKDEEKKLNEKGLKQKMPKDWDEKKWYARYEKSGINIIDLNEGEKIPYNKKFKDIMYKIKK